MSTTGEVNGNGLFKHEGLDEEESGVIEPTELGNDTSDTRDSKCGLAERSNILKQVNGLNCDQDQGLEFILDEQEEGLDEVNRKLPEDFCNQEDDGDNETKCKDSSLCQVNDELKNQLKGALEDLNSHKDKLESMRIAAKKEQEERDRLNGEVFRLQKESVETSEKLQSKVQELEERCAVQETELEARKEKQISHDQAAKKAIAALQKEMALRIDQVTKMYDDVLKEKESLKIKLLQTEEEKKKLLRDNDLLDRKMNDNTKEIEKYRQKLKGTVTDLNKLQTAFDEKEKQLQNSQKDSGKISEELNSHVVKVKWAQNKLKQELEHHKETKTKLSQVTQKLKEAKEEGEQIRADCQAMIKKYQESEEMRSNSLDHKLKEKEHELRKHEQEIADQDEVHRMKMQELEVVKEELKKSQGEVKLLKGQVSMLEEKITQYALKVATHEKNTMIHKKEQQSTKKELEESQTYKAKYESEHEEVLRLNTLDAEQKLRISELESEIVASHSKESELLGFTEKMTTHNAQLQSEISGLQAKLDAILLDKSRVEEKLEQVEKQQVQLESQLSENTVSHSKESDALKQELENKSKAVADLTLSLEDARDQLQVTKRKNAAMIKDLTRQLQHSRKQVDKLESSQLESLSGESKSSSTNSLDKINGAQAPGPSSPTQVTPECRTDSGWVVVNKRDSTGANEKMQAESVQVVGGSSTKNSRRVEELEPDRVALIERICRLQKIHAKKNEKIEFMEEHVAALIEEIQKKSKIIQYYVLRETAGTLAPPKSDFNKAQLSRHGGIMASVYSSKAVDPDMTLELSLEINKKLQAVLEDTILKNMTLKENIDTLGDEITRLNEVHKATKIRRQ